MFTFLLKRFYQAVIVMFVISLVAFSIQDNLGIRCASWWDNRSPKPSATNCARRWASTILSSSNTAAS
ncbi:hypothetical protein H2136_09000 [Aeromonas hydrophila]|uniref:Uncharacterized protein n=1 Tax=Aeromonas hydrophila TaxID=644 RepID=A0A926FNB0_AERHY|nr:hypothetical protein [Aeromonas hydrophila]